MFVLIVNHMIDRFINTQYFPYIYFPEFDFKKESNHDRGCFYNLLFRRWMCIYDLPIFEYLLCDRHLAECYFQFLSVIKHIVTFGKLFIQGTTGIDCFQISEEDFHW